MTKEELLKILIEATLTAEFRAEVAASIEAENKCHEEWERQQRTWWNKHKHDTYDI